MAYNAAGGPTPIPGLKVKPPVPPPSQGQVVVSYQQYSPNTGCCECDTLSSAGVIWVIGLALFAAPFCFIPCCMDSCHEPYQRPVYGNSGAAPGPGYAAQQQQGGYNASQQGSYNPAQQGGYDPAQQGYQQGYQGSRDMPAQGVPVDQAPPKQFA